jgi:hypothetical protein
MALLSRLQRAADVVALGYLRNAADFQCFLKANRQPKTLINCVAAARASMNQQLASPEPRIALMQVTLLGLF